MILLFFLSQITCPSCQYKAYEEDECNVQQPYCKCHDRSTCRPGKPAQRPCHTPLVQKPVKGVTMCVDKEETGGGPEQCQECYIWHQEPIKPTKQVEVRRLSLDSFIRFFSSFFFLSFPLISSSFLSWKCKTICKKKTLYSWFWSGMRLKVYN